MTIPDRLCPFIGRTIGVAQADSPIELYASENPMELVQCKLRKAKWQGIAGNGLSFPMKKFCRVVGSTELQKECLETAKILPATVYEYKTK